MGKAIIVGMANASKGRAFGLLGSDAADGVTARDTLRNALRSDDTLRDAGAASADASSTDADAAAKNSPLALARAMVNRLADAGFNLDTMASNKAALDFAVCETLVSRAFAADDFYTRRASANLPVPLHVAHGWSEARVAQTMVDILTGDDNWKDAVARLSEVIKASAPATVADAVQRRLSTLRQDRSDLTITLKGGVASLAALETAANARGGMSKGDAEAARTAVSEVARKAKADKRDATMEEYLAAVTGALDAENGNSPAQEKTPDAVLKSLAARIRAAAKKMPNPNAAARVAALEAFGSLLQLWGADATLDPVLPHGRADRLSRMADDLLSGRQVEVETVEEKVEEEPKGEEPKGEEPKGEEPKGEEPKGEEKGEEPKGEEKGEEPAPDTALAAAMAEAKAKKAKGRRGRAAANATPA